MNHLRKLAIALSILMLVVPAGVRGQDEKAPAEKNIVSSSEVARLTIVVTGGGEKKPVDSASVYVKYVRERKVIKDKHIEMNLKTSLAGVCHAQAVPFGKILIQVVVPGWKTFGEYYEINQAEQEINISLVRPPKWY